MMSLFDRLDARVAESTASAVVDLQPTAHVWDDVDTGNDIGLEDELDAQTPPTFPAPTIAPEPSHSERLAVRQPPEVIPATPPPHFTASEPNQAERDGTPEPPRTPLPVLESAEPATVHTGHVADDMDVETPSALVPITPAEQSQSTIVETLRETVVETRLRDKIQVIQPEEAGSDPFHALADTPKSRAPDQDKPERQVSITIGTITVKAPATPEVNTRSAAAPRQSTGSDLKAYLGWRR